MLARFSQTVIIFLFPIIISAQSLNLSVSQETSDNDLSTFSLAEAKVSIGNNAFQFLSSDVTINGYQALGVSKDYSKVSLLKWSGKKGEVLMFNSSGDKLIAYQTITLADESSFLVHPFSNGGLVLRDKVANFTFYDTFGTIATSISSSSGSKEGEVISEMAMSPNGETVVVYNPKFKRNGALGSKALVKEGSKFKDIFYSSDRHLKNVTISEDGNIIVLITAKAGTDDQVLILDKFGNDLNTISVDEELIGASVSKNLEYLTLYSGGRVMVYSMLEGESLGATSFRSSIFLADYFSEDNLILALTGNYSESTGVMNGAEFRAVNLEKRAIQSQEISGSLGFHKSIPTRFVRTSADHYKLVGGSKVIEIEANW